jgi:ABC-type Fe3+ transport system permease subunit
MEDILNSYSNDFVISYEFFVFLLIYGVFLGYLLKFFYTKYSKSISEKETFSNIFIFLIIIITLIITIVKSSLALSLGLVGALSIVRFRTAIKNPEDLIFLFMAIGVGLGLGANHPILVTIALSVFLIIYYFINYRKNLKSVSSYSPEIW